MFKFKAINPNSIMLKMHKFWILYECIDLPEEIIRWIIWDYLYENINMVIKSKEFKENEYHGERFGRYVWCYENKYYRTANYVRKKYNLVVTYSDIWMCLIHDILRDSILSDYVNEMSEFLKHVDKDISNVFDKLL